MFSKFDNSAFCAYAQWNLVHTIINFHNFHYIIEYID